MEQYAIKGGVHLEGEVVISGAKNAALGILAAAIMTDDECTIENVPYVSDTITLLKAIENIGASVKYIDKHTVVICGKGIRGSEGLSVDDEFIRKNQSFLLPYWRTSRKIQICRCCTPGWLRHWSTSDRSSYQGIQ
jgi:UDP-N-acetylglucosamine enolpyruvyl transferase